MITSAHAFVSAPTILPVKQGRRSTCGRRWRCCIKDKQKWAESVDIKVDGRVDLSTASVVKNVLKNTELISFPESLVVTGADEKELANQLPVAGPDGEGIGAKSQPIFLWNDDELAMLAGSHLQQRAKELQEELTKANIDPLDYAYIRRNAIDLDGKTHLLPFQYRSADVDAATCGLSKTGGMFFSKPKYNIVARRDLKAGDALTFGRYSAKEGDDLGSLLLEYGEIADSTSDNGTKSTTKYATHVPVDVSISDLDKFKDDKIEILQEEELGPKATFTLKSSSRGRKWSPPDDLDAYLRLMCLITQDAYLLENIFRREVWDFMKLPVSYENEKALCEYMIATCEDALDAYDYSFEDDNNNNSNTKKEMAKDMIEQEKEVLQAAMKSYTARLAGIDQLVYYTERRLDSLDLLRPLDESEIVGDYSGEISGQRAGKAFDMNM